MSVVKTYFDKIDYSTDYADNSYDAAASTFTEIPTEKVIQDGSEPYAAEAQTQETINALQNSTGQNLSGVLAVEVDDEDTFLDDLATASDDRTRVWFRFEIEGQSKTRIIGGNRGCSVTYERQGSFAPGTEMIMISFTASSASADGNFDIGS